MPLKTERKYAKRVKYTEGKNERNVRAIHSKRVSPIEHVVYGMRHDDNAEDTEDVMRFKQLKVVNVFNGA